MRIEPGGSLIPPARGKPAAGQIGSALDGTMTTGDSLDVGQARNRIAGAQLAVQAASDSRGGRVQALRSAIECGTYHVDVAALAASLLDQA
jgi:flagellar biosynthesis anti-sigma factor FlgM